MTYTGKDRRKLGDHLRQDKALLLAGAFLCILFGTMIAIGYLFWFEKPYLKYMNVPFPLEIGKLSSGDIIPIYVARCSSDTKPRIYPVARALQNTKTSMAITLPEIQVAVQPGCSEGLSTAHYVPPLTPPGKYKLYGAAEIRTSFRTHYVEWYSQEFEVVAKP